jgi:hypothetical protein
MGGEITTDKCGKRDSLILFRPLDVKLVNTMFRKRPQEEKKLLV